MLKIAKFCLTLNTVDSRIRENDNIKIRIASIKGEVISSAKYNTNLASEYYVLSMLYRKGLNAYLTLGNKKSVDIILEKRYGKIITLDVKGLAGKTCWPMDNFKKENKNVLLNHNIRDTYIFIPREQDVSCISVSIWHLINLIALSAAEMRILLAFI